MMALKNDRFTKMTDHFHYTSKLDNRILAACFVNGKPHGVVKMFSRPEESG